MTGVCPSAHELNISAQRILHSTVLAGGCNPWISPGQGGSQSVLDANGPSPACPVQVRLQLCSCSTDVRGSRPERQQQVGVQVLVGGLITHMLRGHQLLKLVTCNVWVCVCVHSSFTFAGCHVVWVWNACAFNRCSVPVGPCNSFTCLGVVCICS